MVWLAPLAYAERSTVCWVYDDCAVDASVWVLTVVPSTRTCSVAVNGEVTRPLRYQYVKVAVPAGMTTAWDRLAVWLDDVSAPNLAQWVPVRGGDVELVVEQFDDEHSGVPLRESASVQLGLLGGVPVAASKPPSWMSSAAEAEPDQERCHHQGGCDQHRAARRRQSSTSPHGPHEVAPHHARRD